MAAAEKVHLEMVELGVGGNPGRDEGQDAEAPDTDIQNVRPQIPPIIMAANRLPEPESDSWFGLTRNWTIAAMLLWNLVS